MHYLRPNGNHDGWRLHVWDGAAEPTERATPPRPSGPCSGCRSPRGRRGRKPT
nr:pullulanase-associated domain-containing protein [Nonomuraea basaltis]